MSTRSQSIAANAPMMSHVPHRHVQRLVYGAPHAVFLIVMAIAAIFATIGQVYGKSPATPATTAFVTPGEMRSGALLLKSADDRYVEAPLVGTDVDLSVSGPTARA